MLLKNFSPESKTLIEVDGKRKPKALDLLDYFKKLWPQKFDNEIQRIFTFDEVDIVHILNQVPEIIMNDTEKKWVQCLLISRKKWLLEWYEEG